MVEAGPDVELEHHLGKLGRRHQGGEAMVAEAGPVDALGLDEHRMLAARRTGLPALATVRRPAHRAAPRPGRGSLRVGCGALAGRPLRLVAGRHYGVEIKACQAGDAKRKGKVERPFRDLKESFLQELVVTGVPASIGELNDRAGRWVDQRVHARPHRSTGVAPAVRYGAERPFLGVLPARRFNTDYLEARRVHRALPLVTWDGVRYSVPPGCLGQSVEVRLPVDATELVVSWAGRVVARHQLAPPGVNEVWDPAHRRAAETAALGGTRRRHLHVVRPEDASPAASSRLQLGAGDFDVAVPDLAVFRGGEEEA